MLSKLTVKFVNLKSLENFHGNYCLYLYYLLLLLAICELSIITIQIWYFILAADITEEYTLSPKELPLFDESIKSGIIYRSLIGDGTVTYISHFDDTNPLKVPVCDKKDFKTWTVAPVMTDKSSWVLLGETSKLIKMSEQRIGDITFSNKVIIVHLFGAPQEVVTMAAIDTQNTTLTPENVQYFKCTIPDNGEITLEIPSGRCSSG